MTALTMPQAPTSINANTKRTLKSMKKYTGLTLANGNSNALALHSVDQDLFPCLWSFLAEVMLVEGALPSSTKASISWLVNSKISGIPMPKKSNGNVDPFEAAFEAVVDNEALAHAERILNKEGLDESISRSSNRESTTSTRVLLSREAKAEVAMVVLLFTHLNRSTAALLDQECRSTALASISSSSATKPPIVTNYSSPKAVWKAMNRLAGTGKPKVLTPGITSTLFAPSDIQPSLPDHLLGAGFAGMECVQALFRLVSWVQTYQENLATKGWITPAALRLLESTVPATVGKPGDVAEWIDSADMDALLQPQPNQVQTMIRVLLLVQYAPDSVPKSQCWALLVEVIGSDQATVLVLWWSLRLALDQAHGLFASRRGSGESMSFQGGALPGCMHRG